MTDQDAIDIGARYQNAAAAATDTRVLHLRDIGKHLLSKKESVGQGHWLAWLKQHHDQLGFSEHTARDLMRGAEWMIANWQLTTKLEDIVTDPCPTAWDISKANEIRQLIDHQFHPVRRDAFAHQRNEWYTPAKYVTLVRAVLGDIDVDPASNEHAQRTVRARRYFDREQNGLLQPWFGRVFLNPPYSPPLINRFISKLLMEWDSGRISACIALTHNFTDAAWFHDAAAIAEMVCFTQGRVKFYHPGGPAKQPPHGQAFFYFGRDVELFKSTFDRVGLLARPEPNSWGRRKVRECVG